MSPTGTYSCKPVDTVQDCPLVVLLEEPALSQQVLCVAAAATSPSEQLCSSPQRSAPAAAPPDYSPRDRNQLCNSYRKKTEMPWRTLQKKNSKNTKGKHDSRNKAGSKIWVLAVEQVQSALPRNGSSTASSPATALITSIYPWDNSQEDIWPR